MADATIITYQRAYNNVSVASVGATYVAIPATTTKPTSGVVHDQQLSGISPSLLRILPYANSTSIGADTGVRVIGYTTRVDSTNTTDVYYIPTVLADFHLTFSTTTGSIPNMGIDGGVQRPFAIITQVVGTPAANLYSPGTSSAANFAPAAAMIDMAGYQLVVVQFKAASGTPTMGVFATTL